MGFLDFLRPKPTPILSDRMLEYGTFLAALKKSVPNTDSQRPAPIELRITKFLRIGSDVSVGLLGLRDEGRRLAVDEQAAVVLHVQQGIHAMLTLHDGQEAVLTSGYKDRFSNIFSFVVPIVLQDDPKSPSPECVAAMERGAEITRSAQLENEDMLQKIFDAWQAFLFRPDDTGDDGSPDALATSLSQAIEWSTSRGRPT